jgi:hypothetical protein
MRKLRTIIALAAASGLLLAALGLTRGPGAAASSGGTYTIDWYSIDNGGGASASGAYVLTGTIGQPDAGVQSGGQYEMVGGFWGATDVRYLVRVPYVRR